MAAALAADADLISQIKAAIARQRPAVRSGTDQAVPNPAGLLGTGWRRTHPDHEATPQADRAEVRNRDRRRSTPSRRVRTYSNRNPPPCRSRPEPMKLATIRTGGGRVTVRIEDDDAVELGCTDIGALLADPDWRNVAHTADVRRHKDVHGGLCPGRTASGEDLLRRAQLPHAHPGDGARAAAVSDPVREVRQHPAGCPGSHRSPPWNRAT